MIEIEKRPWGTGTVSAFRGKHRARLPGHLGRGDVGIFDTEARAHAALAQALTDLEAAPLAARTFAAYGLEWMKGRDVREGTLDRDRARWRVYVENMPLGASCPGTLTEADVVEWLGSLAHLAAQTRQNALGLVKQALGAWAKENDATNIAVDVKLPKRARARSDDGWDWLRPKEIGAVIACPMMPKQRAFITLAIFTGLRAGELCGLRWEDVDFDRGIVHVRFSRAEAPKNGKPREVPMLMPALATLLRWREHYEHEGLRSHLDLVFPAPDGGHHGSGYDAGWPEVRAIAKIKRALRFHDLRHTYASHMLQGTWAPRWVARALKLEEIRDLLGHADIGVTQRYAKLCKDGVAALVTRPEPPAKRGTTRGTLVKPPLRFELKTYGLRNRAAEVEQHEGNAAIGTVVPSFVPRLAEAHARLMRALLDEDPFRHQRAAELADVVDDLLFAVECAENGASVRSEAR